MQSKSYAIALTGIATSMALIFVVLGNFFIKFDFAFYFLAGLALLLPIALNFYVMGFLGYLVTALLGLLFGGLSSPYYIFFCTFFGLQPLYSALLQKIKWHKVFSYILETILFLGAVFTTYFVSYVFILKRPIAWINQLGNWVYLILVAVAIPMYVIYAFLMRRMSKRLQIVLLQLNKKNGKIEKELPKEQKNKEDMDPFDQG